MLYAPSEERHPEQRIFSLWLYVVSALGAISQYAESIGMNLAGCVVLLFAGFMLKAQRLTARDTIYSSHVEWISRTMSIGSFILFPLSAAAIFYCVFHYTDIETARHALETADDNSTPVIVGIVKDYVAANEAKLDVIITGSLTPPILWWVRRCWYGYQRAKRSEPIDYPGSIF